jgi:hypothetical protein
MEDRADQPPVPPAPAVPPVVVPPDPGVPGWGVVDDAPVQRSELATCPSATHFPPEQWPFAQAFDPTLEQADPAGSCDAHFVAVGSQYRPSAHVPVDVRPHDSPALGFAVHVPELQKASDVHPSPLTQG